MATPIMNLGEQEPRVSLSLCQPADEYEQRDQRKRRSPEVFLNVYDMLSLNAYVSPFGLGAFHSGVEVYGREYAYGYHPYSYTGIYDMEPRQEGEIAGQQVRFREAISLGHTLLSEPEVRELVVSLGQEYNGCSYSILHRNCNHFTTELSQRLCRASAPRWVNRLAYLGSWMPFVLNCLPPQWIDPNHPNTPHSSQSNCLPPQWIDPNHPNTPHNSQSKSHSQSLAPSPELEPNSDDS